VYNKPHLSYEEQLAKLRSRGLVCADPSRAIDLLAGVGYYHLSAYTYPLRTLLPEGQGGVETPWKFREDSFVTGAEFSQVEALWQFDRRLRLLILAAVDTVEVGIRTRVAHVLGRRDPFGHVHESALNPTAARLPAREGPRRALGIETQFDEWKNRYDNLLSDAARSEDYLKHHLVKYGQPVPVWIAVEFLDFGATGRLFGLMLGSDQNEVARSFGVSRPVFESWIKPLNYLRNLSAHHGRVWNRALTYSLKRFSEAQLPGELKHMAVARMDRVYAPLAVLAYLTRQVDPRSDWSQSLREQVCTFPALASGATVADMGFPTDWEGLGLWRQADGVA